MASEHETRTCAHTHESLFFGHTPRVPNATRDVFDNTERRWRARTPLIILRDRAPSASFVSACARVRMCACFIHRSIHGRVHSHTRTHALNGYNNKIMDSLSAARTATAPNAMASGTRRDLCSAFGVRACVWPPVHEIRGYKICIFTYTRTGI